MDETPLKILLVDDDPDFVGDFRTLLPDYITCHDVASVPQADAFLSGNDVDVVFLDIGLGSGGDGLEYLQSLKSENPYLPVIMISADQGINTVVRAMQLGASHYVGKSPHLDQLKLSIDRAIEENRFRLHYALMESELYTLTGEMIGESETMQSIRREMQRLAEAPSNVLITGRSGTGKELVARGIHRLSSRRSHPFIAVNCPALSHGLIESELFGHEKGAFTGADMKHVGKFEQVDEGTLFLDEITEIPIEVQSKLLRVLQEREFERVGGRHLLPFRGRILASSNRDVDQAVIDGKLREDLLYRLNVTQIHLPPLSQRRDDIPLLVDYFVRIKALEMKKKPPLVSEEAMGLLCSHDWPGNVRELSNCIENAIVYTDREILDMSDLSRCLMHGQLIGTYEESKKKFMAEFQRNYIRVMLQRNHGNLTRTAEEMGVTRQGLRKMMKSCGLEEEDDD
jgi:DNA-binding NtrC family response regulator